MMNVDEPCHMSDLVLESGVQTVALLVGATKNGSLPFLVLVLTFDAFYTFMFELMILVLLSTTLKHDETQ